MEVRIGDFEPAAPVVLAPMAGVTNAPFRALCRRFAPGLVYVNEMVMATALVHGNAKTQRMITFGPDEHPRSLQLYGSDPGMMSRAQAKSSRRELAKLAAEGGTELGRIEIVADLQAARVNSLAFVARQAMQATALVSELEGQYSGTMLVVRPKIRLDTRSSEVTDAPPRNWFWGEVAKHTPVYLEVVLAALMMNLFTIASSIFSGEASWPISMSSRMTSAFAPPCSGPFSAPIAPTIAEYRSVSVAAATRAAKVDAFSS